MKRPLSVTIIGWLFIVAGAVGLVYHASEFNSQRPFQYELVWVCLVRVLAIVAGFFVLRGSNWARWLLIIWIAYHVVLSAFHSLSGVITHSLMLVVVTFFLFRKPASSYFRHVKD